MINFNVARLNGLGRVSLHYRWLLLAEKEGSPLFTTFWYGPARPAVGDSILSSSRPQRSRSSPRS